MMRIPPSPLMIPDSPLAKAARQPMLLGLFLPIQTGGFSQSTFARSTDWSYDFNLQLTLEAERNGFDFVFGKQQWLPKGGFGGDTHYHENFLDPFMSAVALGAATRRIITIATVHVLYGSYHPLTLARYAATVDHITKGRFGLNIVTGYDANEPRMFGMTRPEHGARYRQASEFVSVMKALWEGSDNLTFEGEYYRLEGAYVSPNPRHGRPILVSASASPDGFQYAAEHSDIVFTSSPAGADFSRAIEALPEHTASIRAAYSRTGRTGKSIIFPMIVCKPTREEAFAYRDAILQNADTEAIRGYAARHAGGDAQGWQKHVTADRILGGHVQIVGSPEDVADAIEKLHHAGIDGVQIGFYDYVPDFAFFIKHVLPLLEQRGLRHPLQD